MKTDILNQVTQNYFAIAQGLYHSAYSSAMNLFFSLAVIQLAWIGIMTMVKGSSPIPDVFKHLMKISFFYAIILHAGTWIPDIINSFVAMGKFNISTLDPSSVAGQGVAIAVAILKETGSIGILTNLVGALIASLSAVIIIVSYGLIAGMLTVTLIQAYFLIAYSTVFLAFASTKWTFSFAQNYLIKTVSVGIKLMTLYVIISGGQTLGQLWVDYAADTSSKVQFEGFFVIWIGAVMYVLLIFTLPTFIASIVTGGHDHGTTEQIIATTTTAVSTSSQVAITPIKMALRSGQAAQHFSSAGEGYRGGGQGAYGAASAAAAGGGGGSKSAYGGGGSNLRGTAPATTPPISGSKIQK